MCEPEKSSDKSPSVLEVLRFRLAESHAVNEEAVQMLKDCSREVTRRVPIQAGSRPAIKDPPSGTHQLPQIERLELKKAQLEASRERGKEALERLKSTSKKVVNGFSFTEESVVEASPLVVLRGKDEES